MPFALILFFVVVLIISIYRYRNSRPKTKSIMSNLELVNDKLVIKNAYCSMSTYGIGDLDSYNVFIFNNCIILHEAVTTLVGQKYYELNAPTFIFSNKKQALFDYTLFNNKMEKFTINLKGNGEIIISGYMSGQSAFSSLGFTSEYERKVKIRTNMNLLKLEAELKRYNLL